MTLKVPRLFSLGWPPLTRANLRADFLAGLTGAVVVLPQGVAFATLAGLPPEFGLYAAMVPAIVAALFGSSWHLVSGPTNAVSIVVFATMSALAEPGSARYISLVLCLTLATGVLQLGLGLARLGSLVNLISHSVVLAFTAGAAILIIGSQVRNFFGLPIPRGADFVDTLVAFGTHLGQINPYVTAVGVVTLAAGIVVRRLWPRMPHMLFALVAGSLCALLLNREFGASITGITTVGALPAFLPPLTIPDISLLREIAPAAFAVTLLGLTEAVSIGRSIAVRSGQRIDGNREFIGQGLSNIAGSFFSSYVASGSFNRSGLNYDSGARTPMAAILSAPLLAVILFFVAPLAAYLPLASMAAVLFIVAWGLIDFRHAREIAGLSGVEGVVMALTFFSTLLIQLEIAILVGVVASLMLYLNRATRPAIQDEKPAPEPGSTDYTTDSGLPDCPQLKILRVDGSIFFGAVDHVRQAISRRPGMPQKHLLLVSGGINFVDAAGTEMLAHEARERRANGGALYFHRMKQAVRDFMYRGRYAEDLGRDNVFPAKIRALAEIYPRLDSEICRRCQFRIFDECQERLPSGELRESTPSPASGDPASRSGI
ncbi:MAG TPA: SulP family inorganic anion transporter [Caldimonas sp.]|nr:SulP family inorganic anion transporter [Caldimonas sp.]HEX2542703.1 SulP family inorganic anion transporter [Caldimonas sp.]